MKFFQPNERLTATKDIFSASGNLLVSQGDQGMVNDLIHRGMLVCVVWNQAGEVCHKRCNLESKVCNDFQTTEVRHVIPKAKAKRRTRDIRRVSA